MLIEVEWTRSALREFTHWVAAFARDEIGLRVARKFHLNMIDKELRRSDGHPPGSSSIPFAEGEIVVWEYSGSEIWLSIRRIHRKANWIQRWLGRVDYDALIVTSTRHRPTLQELQSLLE